jgi:hypothetical protein
LSYENEYIYFTNLTTKNARTITTRTARMIRPNFNIFLFLEIESSLVLEGVEDGDAPAELEDEDELEE